MNTVARSPRRRRTRNTVLLATVVGLVAAVNYPVASQGVAYAVDAYETSRPEYKAEFGHWQTLEFPGGIELNATHAVLLHTGKVLIVAGSGNNRHHFEAGTFKTLLWDPTTTEAKEIDTPEDLWCGGHALLPNGDVLIAGGTREYEVLADDVTRAAGPVLIRNESPDDQPFELAAGTRIASATGVEYEIVDDVTIAPAVKDETDPLAVTVTASETSVWAQAVEEGEGAVVEGGAQYEVQGLTGDRATNVYALSDGFTLDKQNYRGLDASYVFDVEKEEYVATGRLNHSRWYPTLTSMNGGNVLAVSGLDEFGEVLEGQNEVFEISQNAWFEKPELRRYFPTYPGLHRLEGGELFYSGSTSGYGNAEEARTPGVWDLTDNTFVETPGLRDPDLLEYSSSVLLPPAQDQRVAVIGGGGVGESDVSSSRIDVADLDAAEPAFRPVADLRTTRRYPNVVTLPDDTVLITGGSVEYRGRHDSDVFEADLYDPATETLRPAADPRVGRNYHATSILLPNGAVMTMGSDPLFADAESTTPGTFEQRVEIFSPPYLFQGEQPEALAGPEQITRGTTVDFTSPTAGDVTAARLVRPSAATHQMDPEQRSVRLDVTPGAVGSDGTVDSVALSVPAEEGLLPSGWYMLFALDAEGVPSDATWVQVL